MMCLSDKYMIFNGKLLHKKAILRKGTPKPAHAALIAGTTEDKLGQKDADHIISRMKELRTNFRSRVVHHVKSRWVDSAINAKMKFSKTGVPVSSYDEMYKELISVPTMENFQHWYNIFYRCKDVKNSGWEDAESMFMDGMGIKYHDLTNNGGCIGELFSEEMGSLMESLAKGAKNKQGMHLVKSRPMKDPLDSAGRRVPSRRNPGDYYLVRSEKGSTRVMGWWWYNVRSMSAVLHFCYLANKFSQPILCFLCVEQANEITDRNLLSERSFNEQHLSLGGSKSNHCFDFQAPGSPSVARSVQTNEDVAIAIADTTSSLEENLFVDRSQDDGTKSILNNIHSYQFPFMDQSQEQTNGVPNGVATLPAGTVATQPPTLPSTLTDGASKELAKFHTASAPGIQHVAQEHLPWEPYSLVGDHGRNWHSPGSTSSLEGAMIRKEFGVRKVKQGSESSDTQALKDQIRKLEENQERMTSLMQRLESTWAAKSNVAEVKTETSDGRPGPTGDQKLSLTNGKPQNIQPKIKPSSAGGTHYRSKNAERRAKYQKRREEQERMEQLRKEQELKKEKAVQDFHKHLKNVESNRSRCAKKGITEEQDAEAKKKIKSTSKVLGQVKVKRHGKDKEGKMKVLFRKADGEDEWLFLEDIWKPDNVPFYVPVWREYCQRKGFPINWGSAAATTADPFLSSAENQGEEYNPPTGPPNYWEEEAVCVGHVLDDRGLVFMELLWKDDNSNSRAMVKKIMASNTERAQFGPTWNAYCDRMGFLDDRFRIEGTSLVDQIVGCSWSDCGRPMADIAWKHGDLTKVMVKDAMEINTDNNGFKEAWKDYCWSVGKTEESFLKGHVNKEFKKVTTKRKRRRIT